MLQARIVQVRGEGKIIYICCMPLAVLPMEMRQRTQHFHLFFTLFHYITAITDRVTIAVFIPAIFSMFAGRLKVWAKSGVVNVACFHIQK